MLTCSRRTPAALALMLCMLAGCATTQSPADGPPARAGNRAGQVGPQSAAPDSTVRTVQLYAGEEERRLPVMVLGGGAPLTLEFDLMTQRARPLSVYFYHADRTWERDAAPARFLTGFRSDDLLDYQSARARGVPYVHYVYRFPGEGGVGFQASGNYILRVTEQGREEEVLFERPFFVAEQAGDMELSLDALRFGTQSGLSDRPSVRYRPPPALGSSAFDYTACFVPGTRLRLTRCVDRPEFGGQPVLLFELPLRDSFDSGTSDFFLDLSSLAPGGGITDSDQTVVPPHVELSVDYADFAGAGQPPLLDGQIVVREAGINVIDPALSAEYAAVEFRFAPPERQRLSGPVVLSGSFYEGPLEDAPRLRWRPSAGFYTVQLLLKQGLYEYRYASPDPALRRTLAQNQPLARRRYTAFVYYRDGGLGSDRLLLVRRAEAQ